MIKIHLIMISRELNEADFADGCPGAQFFFPSPVWGDGG